MRQIQSVNKRHQYVKNPTPPPSQNGFGVNSAAQILQFFELCKENVCFYAFGDIFWDFRSQKNATQQDGVEWIKRIVNYWGMLKFIRIEKDGDGAIVDEVHFFSGIRMQTGEEVVHSKISEQDEEEGDNTEDMVDDWW